jgi:tetratricopeptide (TPR) repeat protein
LLKQQGEYAAAVRHYRQALSIRRSVLGPAHPKTLLILRNLAGALWEQEKYGEVETVLRERVGALRAHTPGDSNRLGEAMGGLARFLLERGRFEEAAGSMREVYRIYRQQHGPDALYTVCKGGELGAALKALGREQEAEPLLRRHHRILQARRDNILQHRDTYTRLDVVYNLRAMITVFERAGLGDLARKYQALRDAYQPEAES